MSEHMSKDEFLLEFFGMFGRELGRSRRFTNNPSDMLTFIDDCIRNKQPAFISTQPKKDKETVVGIEKLFYDFDFGKKSEVLSDEEIKKRTQELESEVKFFINHLNGLNIKPLVVKTRRGYHVYVFLDLIYCLNAKVLKDVYKQLQTHLMEGHEYKYSDSSVIGDINRLCRIPFSVHQETGQECFIVNSQLKPDKVRSLEFFKLYGLKQTDVKLAISKITNVKSAVKKEFKFSPESTKCYSSKGIRPCFQKAIEAHEMCHNQRLALLSEAYCAGYQDKNSLVNIFRSFNDFNEGITSYQVDYFFKNTVYTSQAHPYKCVTIKGKGWCLGEQCPLFKGKISDQ